MVPCLLISVLGCAAGVAPLGTNHAATPSPIAITPTGETLHLEVMISPDERARGMMQRADAPRGTGMLFLFDTPARHEFWMYNCLIPLDLIWLDAQGTVVFVQEAAPPCTGPPESCPHYQPDRMAVRVLEVAAHEARRLGLLPGARLVLEGIPSERKR